MPSCITIELLLLLSQPAVGLVVEGEVYIGALLQVGIALRHIQRVGSKCLADQIRHGWRTTFEASREVQFMTKLWRVALQTETGLRQHVGLVHLLLCLSHDIVRESEMVAF